MALRWNGWGDTAHEFPLPEHGIAFLQDRVGVPKRTIDISRDGALAQVTTSKLGENSLWSLDPGLRLDRAYGQSFPDWIAMRYGSLNGENLRVPDAVATPQTREDIQTILKHAGQAGIAVIPYAGGTSVVGHLTPTDTDDRPVLSLDLSQMNQLLHLDNSSHIATFQPGVPGMSIEQQLKPHGYLLGHFPQSYELSTLGGWVVTRSSGQQSARYGRIEQMFAGGHLDTPVGSWALPDYPATGAGPEVREMVLGSEGRMGVLSEVKVRVTPLPEKEEFHAVFFPNWEAALNAIRSLAQARLGLSMLRVSNNKETETQLLLAGHQGQIALLKRYLKLRGAADDKCMLMLGVTGSKRQVKSMLSSAGEICRPYKGVWVGQLIGKTWEKNRFHSPYLRDSLWEHGLGVDTLETAITWDKTTDLMQTIEQSAHDSFAKFDERVHAFTHLSHTYPSGSSIYSTFIFRLGEDAQTTYDRWYQFKHTICQAIVDAGGTISHQHGVGLDHKPYLPQEKGQPGIDAAKAIYQTFDPNGIMNPGKLID